MKRFNPFRKRGVFVKAALNGEGKVKTTIEILQLSNFEMIHILENLIKNLEGMLAEQKAKEAAKDKGLDERFREAMDKSAKRPPVSAHEFMTDVINEMAASAPGGAFTDAVRVTRGRQEKTE